MRMCGIHPQPCSHIDAYDMSVFTSLQLMLLQETFLQFDALMGAYIKDDRHWNLLVSTFNVLIN